MFLYLQNQCKKNDEYIISFAEKMKKALEISFSEKDTEFILFYFIYY